VILFFFKDHHATFVAVALKPLESDSFLTHDIIPWISLIGFAFFDYFSNDKHLSCQSNIATSYPFHHSHAQLWQPDIANY